MKPGQDSYLPEEKEKHVNKLNMQDIVPLLQVAIGPVILISGIGLLLLTMTNRFGRIIDRSRILARELHESSLLNPELLSAQVKILMKRARLMRLSIYLASFSVLCTAILIIIIFLTALLRLEAAWLIFALFSLCMLALIISLLAFILDINQSLVALKLEIKEKKDENRL
jgi:hypothetical protein